MRLTWHLTGATLAADLLLHVADFSHPDHQHQIRQVTETLRKLNVDTANTEKMVTGDYEPCERRVMDGQLYRSLMVNGGYSLEAGAGLVRVHCQPRTDRFLSNGYYEARGYAPGDEDREEPVVIVAMLPGQGLQPHSHDLDEELLVG